jgi:hypothetical protein
MAISLATRNKKEEAPASVPVQQQLAELRVQIEDLARSIDALDVRARELPELMQAAFAEAGYQTTRDLRARYDDLEFEARLIPGKRGQLLAQLAGAVERYQQDVYAQIDLLAQALTLRLRVLESELRALGELKETELATAGLLDVARREIVRRGAEVKGMDPLEAYRQYGLTPLPALPPAN